MTPATAVKMLWQTILVGIALTFTLRQGPGFKILGSLLLVGTGVPLVQLVWRYVQKRRGDERPYYTDAELREAEEVHRERVKWMQP